MTDTTAELQPIQRPPALELSVSDMSAYTALSSGAVFFEMSRRHVSVFSGAKAVDALNGLVTNDLSKLAVGRGLYAAALNPKGKMLADLAIYRLEPEKYLVETSEFAGREWFAMVRKYVNPRLSQYKDESGSHTAFGLYGPEAPALLAKLGTGALGDAEITAAMQQGLEAWPDWAHSAFALPGLTVRLIRAPFLGPMPGFQLLVPEDQASVARVQLARNGTVEGSDAVWQMAALESGRPVFGLDMDATTIPQEANLDDWSAISYEKGCYTGQETVARIHFRGHVNKHLRGLRAKVTLALGATVHDEAGKLVGEVRRSGDSPRAGHVAIAMLRREPAVGSSVVVRSSDGDVSATIESLPFDKKDL